MKYAALTALVLATSMAVLRIWTGDTRFTGTGIILLIITVVLTLVTVAQIGYKAEQAKQSNTPGEWK